MWSIIIFIVLQFINVVVSTLRSILTVKASKATAAVISAVSYTFYNGIVKLITGQELWLVLIVTFVTNIIGVWLAEWIFEKTRKDKLWIINTTYKGDKMTALAICDALHCLNIGSVMNETISNNLYTIQIYSYNQKESDLIMGIIHNYDMKYCIIETNTEGRK